MSSIAVCVAGVAMTAYYECREFSRGQTEALGIRFVGVMPLIAGVRAL